MNESMNFVYEGSGLDPGSFLHPALAHRGESLCMCVCVCARARVCVCAKLFRLIDQGCIGSQAQSQLKQKSVVST